MSVVGILADSEIKVVNEGRSPKSGIGDSSCGNELSKGGIEPFEEPGGSVGDLNVHLEGEASNKVEVSPVGGRFDEDQAFVSVVGSSVSGSVESNERVTISLSSLLVCKSEGS